MQALARSGGPGGAQVRPVSALAAPSRSAELDGDSSGTGGSSGRMREAAGKQEMGRYVINGEVVDVREDRPIGAHLKEAAGINGDDWVMVTMPNGQILRLPDQDPLPSEVTDVTIVPRYQYGH
ncbi:hypothetical protein GCM10009760_09060 [Kitasatospora kazusensis]|uniref:DUF1918 domain-containing protein n=1 Tax=Kitasatospora kazusensis TaxID=407974 RepID=A0ABP5KP80_9ACTN